MTVCDIQLCNGQFLHIQLCIMKLVCVPPSDVAVASAMMYFVSSCVFVSVCARGGHTDAQLAAGVLASGLHYSGGRSRCSLCCRLPRVCALMQRSQPQLKINLK